MIVLKILASVRLDIFLVSNARMKIFSQLELFELNLIFILETLECSTKKKKRNTENTEKEIIQSTLFIRCTAIRF